MKREGIKNGIGNEKAGINGFAFLLIAILIISIFLIGCTSEKGERAGEETKEQQGMAGFTDEQILEKYPDDLDGAIKELEEVEGEDAGA